jgi:large subunit ribosomal protein L16
MAKKKNILRISNKIKFRKPSKALSNKPTVCIEFRKTQPTIARYSIQAAKNGLLTRNQLEAGRIVLKRCAKLYNGKVVVLFKPDRIVTKRALETRMGRGKGAPNKQVALLSRGQLIYEVDGPPFERMQQLFAKVRQKISVPTALISAENAYFRPMKKRRK